MHRAVADKTGRCPYCAGLSYDPTKTEERRPGQFIMQCSYPCSKWSVQQRGAQYPLQNPNDPASPPSVLAHFD